MYDIGTILVGRAESETSDKSSSAVSVLCGQRFGSTQLWLGVAFVTLAYGALICFTKPITWGDTIVYAHQIANYSRGILGRHRFWEFGHLLWRPIGYLIWRLGQPYWSHQFAGSQPLQIYAALRLGNLVLGYVAALASFGIAWKISRSIIAGALVASAFLCWNPFINYFQSGTAYVPGLSMQLIGTYLLLADSGECSRGRAWLAGIALALSVCLWFPYAFGLPGIFLLAYLWKKPDSEPNRTLSRTRLCWLAHAVAVCALAGIGFYAVGTSLAGVRSVQEFRTWVAEAGHDFQPQKKYLRVATGLPRGLVELSQDGMLLKRLILKDLYNPASVYDLLHTSLWKLLLFYAGMAGLIWSLSLDRDARPVLLPLLLSGGLLLFFAVVLFEPSQPERWMFGFSVLLPAIAFAFRKDRVSATRAIPLGIFLSAICLTNIVAYATPSEPGADNPTVSRIVALKPWLAPHSIVTLLSFGDGISLFVERFPFHPLNPLFRTEAMQFYFLTEPGSANSPRWRENFAARGLKSWQENGDIWISKRLLASRPWSEWGWVESDDPYLKWRDIATFFAGYTFDGDVGGTDGFLRIARAPTNQKLLAAMVRPPGETH